MRRSGAKTEIGSREYQEDVSSVAEFIVDGQRWSLFGVFDGHAGDKISRWLGANLATRVRDAFLRHKVRRESEDRVRTVLQDTFDAVNAELYSLFPREVCGSTATVLLHADDYVYIANTGDSRTIVFDDRGKLLAKSNDAKPTRRDEIERVRAAGGHISGPKDDRRVLGDLAMTRAFGDFALTSAAKNKVLTCKGVVIATPEVTFYRVERCRPIYAILASDGLWDEVSSEEAAERALAERNATRSNERVAAMLVGLALARDPEEADNTTVLFTQLCVSSSSSSSSKT